MTNAEKIKNKLQLHAHAVAMIRQRIAEARSAMENAQASANAEEKSSAGDKYETSRAMNQLDKDMHAKQLAANNQELAALLSIDTGKLNMIVEPGSVVEFDHFAFFIAAGLGKIHFMGKEIYFISATAPVARSLFNKGAGDKIEFNKEQLVIKHVY